MASITPQQVGRNSSHPSEEPSRSESRSRDDAVTLSMVSEDSQTVLLNNPLSSSDSTAQAELSPSRPAPPTRSSTSGINKCWICICDSTEDDLAHPPKWRSPCTCNLAAHEACLLDWVATIENTRGKHGSSARKIQCPQCKSEIKISRPRSLVLAGIGGLSQIIAKATLPGMIAMLGSTLWAGCFHHGLHSVRVVFGEPQALWILHRASRHWGWLSGYALIPITLIAAKTEYADFILPGSTVFLFATQLIEPVGMDWHRWPPRPSTVFACLPIARSAYNYLYEKAFGGLNRKWLEDVRPRQMQEADDPQADEAVNGGAQGEEAPLANPDVLLELNLEIGMEINDGEDEALDDARELPPPQENPRAAIPDAGRADNAVVDNQDEQHNDAAEQGDGNQQANPALLQRRPNQLVSDTATLFRTTASALLFPSIAAGMGALLELALPFSWTKPSSYSTLLANDGRERLLRTRWGRSVLGGCLFVVLKDTLLLYARWRLARDHQRRKIMDWDRRKNTWVLND